MDQSLLTIQDAILRQLHDDDLTVVRAALSLDGLCDILSDSDLLKELEYVFKRCVGILMSGAYHRHYMPWTQFFYSICLLSQSMHQYGSFTLLEWRHMMLLATFAIPILGFSASVIYWHLLTFVNTSGSKGGKAYIWC